METKIFPGIQSYFQAAGEAACYALSIIKLAEQISGLPLDPYQSLLAGTNSGCVTYNKENPADPDNFYVADPEGFLRRLAGVTATVRKEAADYRPAPDEYIIQCWERQVTGKTITHFRLPDWDSLADSQTVKYGRIASLRVYKAA